MLHRLQYVGTDGEKNYFIVDPIVKEYLKKALVS